jgi:1-acyl-sn-glycerol-3-phosphate acyltransferase
VLGRLLWFSGALVLMAVDFVGTCAFRPASVFRQVRIAWLQRSARRALRVLNARYSANGPIPARGLLVCNHLTYLDILVLAAMTPAVFVSRSDVKYWPVFGWAAVLAGTIFVNRQRRTQVGEISSQMRQALDSGALVVLFPEGTSSDASTILPFKTSLLEPAIGSPHPLSIGLLRYAVDEGDVSRDICYWGDMNFVPHLFNLLNLPGFEARVEFKPVSAGTADRKELARQLRAQLLELHGADTSSSRTAAL